MATLQNIGKLKYRGKDGQWHPLPVVVQDTGGGVSTISGKGAPTSETQGEVNQLYRDEDTQKLYICTSTDGGYTWAEVSGGSVDVDATLTKAGQAADAKATGDAIVKKIDKAQGTGNAGKILGIGADGNVTPQDKPVQALAGAAAPTTATAGVVGQEYYVIVGNAVTEMYVCTAVANGTYTWGKAEFIAEESDPTVPAWAKAAQKPSYTASEVGADPSGTAASQVSAHNSGTDTHSDIRLLISGLTDRLNALADSDDTTLDQLSEVVAYIKGNRTMIEAITTSKVSVSDIIDNLTTNVTNKPLSAAQGVALKALIDAISVPDKLPNPNALTFTGAVTGSYDGSASVTVEIPSGGAYEGIYSLLVEHTITEDVSEVVYTNEEYPGIANLKHILISIIFPERHTTGWWKIISGDATIMSAEGGSNVKHYYGVADVKCGHWIWSVNGTDNENAERALSSPSVMFSPKFGFMPSVYNDYSSLRLYGYSFTLTAGTVVRIWGCDL